MLGLLEKNIYIEKNVFFLLILFFIRKFCVLAWSCKIERNFLFQIISLDVGAIVADTEIRGTFEGRLKKVIKEVTDYDGQTMLFIDEIHLLVRAGSIKFFQFQI